MKRIASFEVDHTVLQPGMYLSRTDGDVVTYDLRFIRPNTPPFLPPAVLHTIEHLFATYIRNGELGPDILYFGPMGCQTGFYLLVRNADNARVLAEVRRTMQKILEHEGPVFGASSRECGNYINLNLECAQKEARRYLAELDARSVTFTYEE